MRLRRLPATGAQHEQAVARRLALLSEELAAVRAAQDQPEQPEDDGWWEPPPLRAVPDAADVLPEGPAAIAEPGPPGEPPRVPVPGRHAARRRAAVSAAVPASLRGPVALGPGQLSVVAVLVAVALAVTCWWVVRGDAEDAGALGPVEKGGSAGSASALVAAPTPTVPGAGTPTGPVGASGSAAAAMVTVDVAGKVRRPGIAVLPGGSRVVDALEAAGGARPGVDLSGLNLARVLTDGEQVLVGASPPPMAAAPGLTAGNAPAGGGMVSLNTATAAQLEALPEVGPVTAEAIVAWRDQNGGFTSVDQLLEVDGIGEATLAKIAPHVTL